MRLRLLASIIYQMIQDDTDGFRTKLAERLRQMGVPGAGKIRPKMKTDEVHGLVHRGELSEALKLLNATSRRPGRNGRQLRKHLTQQLAELQLSPPAADRTLAELTQPPRVLHLLTNSVPHTSSGYTQRSHHVLQALQSEGMNVEAVTRLAYPLVVGRWPRGKTEVVEGIRYHRLLPPTYPAAVEQRHSLSVDMLSLLVEEHNIGVLHTTTNFPNAIVASRVAQRCHIPWVYEIRGELEKTWLSRLPEEEQELAVDSEFFRLARQQETSYAKAADAVIVLSEISRRQLIQRGVPAEKITVIPNAVDSDFLTIAPDRTALRQELELPQDRKLVGTVSSLVDYEGIDILVRAIKNLPEEYSALIVGDGTARPYLEELAAEEGVTERVIFAGRQAQIDIWKWYSVLDTFVVPRHDTPVCRTVTPLKALSAQALGIPVVATDLPALREVTGGLAAYIPTGDPEALAEAIQNPGEGASGRQWAAGRTWQTMSRRYIQVYASLGTPTSLL